jgi:hypothetical protein
MDVKAEEQAPAPTEPSAAAALPPASAAIVDAWVREEIYGSEATRDTAGFNYLMKAIENLKRRLAAQETKP